MRTTVVFGCLIGALVILGAFFLVFAIASVAYGLASRRWPAVRGKIESASLRSTPAYRGGRQFWADIRYSYTVDDKAYVGKRIGFVKLGGYNAASRSRSDAERLLLLRPPGQAVHVSYSPRNPRISALQVGVDFAGVLNCLLVAILGLLFLSLGFLFANMAHWV